MSKIVEDYTPRKGLKKTRQGQGRGSKFGMKNSKKYYVKKKRGQG
jgi:hypothetical protein